MSAELEQVGSSLLIAMSNTGESLTLIRSVVREIPDLEHKAITLMHYITPVYWENGGGVDQSQVDRIRQEEEAVWQAERKRKFIAESYFETARFILQDAGVPDSHIRLKFTYAGDSVSDAVLKELKSNFYTTVIIGEHHHAALTKLLSRDLADVIHDHAPNVQMLKVELEQVVPKTEPLPTPLRRLMGLGQSVWLDFLSRRMLESGELWHMIRDDGLRGLTSNPTIFDEAISQDDIYDRAIRLLTREDANVRQIYDELTLRDVQYAADIFGVSYQRLENRDGFVSLEVSPHLAHDTEGTIKEARRLWINISRPNAMIKIPATREGIPAIRQLISEGVNVNVTLLFGLDRYREVVQAYIDGLEACEDHSEMHHIASVASFFLSRIDVLVDPLLEARMKSGGAMAERARQLHGQVAIASAKIAYQTYKQMFASERFHNLEMHGARPQRLLWASTSTKNPAYSDVMYVDGLIGANTVTTIPLKTYHSYQDHGDPAARLETDIEQAQAVLAGLKDVGIDLKAVTQQLENEGVEKFIRSYDSLMDTLQERRAQVLKERTPANS